ncbi:MAG: 16S rRNA (guanine(527)-N(7))-methyltransferase RsmG [Bernardetiaceae bacterium]|jgi:16S rRNA (guanine527-N7)-methyltransferase|nr:16S rRNA (guanine(527)-N(7))-methyltransferase RsmG [Bernardetiaceae bacterium]
MSAPFAVISHYFPGLTEGQTRQLQALGPLYEDWNAKINVISRKDLDNFYIHHVLHSLAVAKVIEFAPGSRLIDVGTGGGFPGLPLAILFPQVEFLLVDSIGKKLKVVDDVAQQIGLANVRTRHTRAEDVKDIKFDFVLARAVAEAPKFYQFTKHLIARRTPVSNSLANGFLLLKGGDTLFDEFGDLDLFFKIYDLKDYFREEYFDTKKLVYVKAR